MEKFTCNGCGTTQPIKGGRVVGQNMYSRCENCGCATKIEASNEVFSCTTCGIIVIRDPGFAGNECSTCEDHKMEIKGRAWDLAHEYNITLGQLIMLIRSTPLE